MDYNLNLKQIRLVVGVVTSAYRIRDGIWAEIGRMSPQLPQVRVYSIKINHVSWHNDIQYGWIQSDGNVDESSKTYFKTRVRFLFRYRLFMTCTPREWTFAKETCWYWTWTYFHALARLSIFAQIINVFYGYLLPPYEYNKITAIQFFIGGKMYNEQWQNVPHKDRVSCMYRTLRGVRCENHTLR